MRFDSEEDTQFEDSDATEYDPFPLGARITRASRRITTQLAHKLRSRAVPPPPPRRAFDPVARQRIRQFTPDAPPMLVGVRELPAPIRNLMLPIPSVAMHDQRYVMTERVPKVNLSGFSITSWAQRLVAPIVAAAIVLGVVLGIALTGGDAPSLQPLAVGLPAPAPVQKITVTAIATEEAAPVAEIPGPKPVARPIAKATKRRAVSVDSSTALGFLRVR